MIDWSRICELRDEVGAEDFDEVVDLFLEEVSEVIARLKRLDNREALNQDLHFLKGSALSLGFSAFSILCQTGERLATEGRAGEVNLQEIFECFEHSRATFTAELSEHMAA